MSSTLLDPAVIASVLVAIVVTSVILVAHRAAGVVVPSIVAPVVALAVALVLADLGADRYTPGSVGGYPVWMVLTLGVAMALVCAAARRSRGAESRTNLLVVLAAAACAAYLYIPETDVLRIFPGAFVIVAIAAALFGLPPIGEFGLAVLGALLVWMSVVDGSTRPTTILATAAVLALASLAPSLRTGVRETETDQVGSATRSGRRSALGVLAVAIVVVGRVLGTATSSIAQAFAVGIVGALALVFVAAVTASGRRA